MTKKLIGKISIVTGGNTGIGRAVSLALANEGSNLIIAWHDREEEANTLKKELQQKNIEIENQNCLINLLVIRFPF